MFLSDLDQYLGTAIIFVSVILVIILVYLIFFMPKGKRIREVRVEKKPEEVKVEEKKVEQVVTKETKVTPQNIIKLEPFKFEKRDNDIKLLVKPEMIEDDIEEPVNLEELEQQAEKETAEEEAKTLEPVEEVSQVVSSDKTKEKEEIKELGKYHVLYRKDDNKWYIKREGSDKILRVLETQAEAIAWATIKALNQDTAIVIHKRDGKIRKQNY